MAVREPLTITTSLIEISSITKYDYKNTVRIYESDRFYYSVHRSVYLCPPLKL
jgi:hypothetical protein